ncbi:hypothetical protein LF887_05485 [Chryseobacterium sp. MEBOG06]|uniref:hypothetical protein n=1 Tax=Chryseobacterium sp. MEBOG06 TaxID=2879938 RepID=UPI001F418278|nr:hypothetical protein [Chryseobacterium sp. MEBOG06]UKB85080.1 hypothetical protein LF887_05485 [Chryseobacterium sp. MEBOG06]
MKGKIFLFLIIIIVFVCGTALLLFSDFLKNNQEIKINNDYLLLKTDEFENYNLMSSKYGGYSLVIPDICKVYQFNNKIMIFSKESGSFSYSTHRGSNNKEQLNLYYILSDDSISQISEKNALYNKKLFKLKFISPFCK